MMSAKKRFLYINLSCMHVNFIYFSESAPIVTTSLWLTVLGSLSRHREESDLWGSSPGVPPEEFLWENFSSRSARGRGIFRPQTGPQKFPGKSPPGPQEFPPDRAPALPNKRILFTSRGLFATFFQPVPVGKGSKRGGQKRPLRGFFLMILKIRVFPRFSAKNGSPGARIFGTPRKNSRGSPGLFCDQSGL